VHFSAVARGLWVVAKAQIQLLRCFEWVLVYLNAVARVLWMVSRALICGC